tara:strand:+ start:68 stop:511 length:444 start_codon:yes stop_codon:yes gene_type:complete
MSHHKQLDNVLKNLEGEVEHVMVSGGCNEQCVQKMKDDGMLDDPSYVAYECKCASNWVKFESNSIEVIPTELSSSTKAVHPKNVVKPSNSGAIHLTEFTCACIIIFAVQAVICFAMLAWCVNKEDGLSRQKVCKQSEFYEFLYEFHE